MSDSTKTAVRAALRELGRTRLPRTRRAARRSSPGCPRDRRSPTVRRRPARAGLPASTSATLYALVFITPAAGSLIVPLLPRMSELYGLSPSASSVLLAAPSVATLLMSVPTGLFVDRLGVRAMTIGSAVLVAASTLAQAVPSYGAILVGRLLFGIGYAILLTAAFAWMSKSEGERGGRQLGALATCGAVGNAAGTTIAGMLSTAFGLASPFIAVAAIATGLTAVLWRCPRPDHGPAQSRERAGLEVARSGFRELLLLGSINAQFLVGLAGGIVLFLVPIELRATGAGADAIGLAFTLSAILYIAISAVFVALGRRTDIQRWLGPAAVALTVALFLGVLNGRPTTVVSALSLSMAARAALVTISFAAVPEIGRRIGLGDGVVIGIFNTAWAVGMLLAPLIAGVVDQATGAQLAYLTAVIPCAAGAICLVGPRLTVAATRLRPVTAGARRP